MSDQAGVLLSSQKLPTTQRRSTFRSRHSWLIRRVLLSFLTLYLVSTLVFVATQALPSDATTTILRGSATPERVEALRAELGLDRPLITQYWDWLSGVLRGDFGSSLLSREPIADIVTNRLINTSALVVFTLAVSLPLSLLIGSICAIRRDRAFDHGTQIAAVLASSIPEFVIGIVLVLLFSTGSLTWFPAVSEVLPGEVAYQYPSSLVLPVVALCVGLVPYLTRLFRASLIDALESDYVEMARLKGLPERRVLLRHALPNALAPAIQGTAVGIAWLTGGVVVIEYLFNFRGMGGTLVDAITNRDLPMIQAVVLVLAALIVVSNLVADVVTVLVSPRARTATS